MKKLTLPRLKSLAPQPKKKVQKLAANAAHRLTPPAFEDYDEEPSTKLSTAFVVVLILHLVAVGGIYAFHSIKAHRKGSETQASEVSKPVAVTVASQQGAPVAASGAPAKPVVAAITQPKQAASSAPASTVGAPVTQNKVAGKPDSGLMPIATPTKVAPVVVPAAGPAQGGVAHVESAANAQVPGKTYTVVKGDNPVSIAKRLAVTEDELLKLNGISDPKKLQIGQVLKVPAKKGAN